VEQSLRDPRQIMRHVGDNDERNDLAAGRFGRHSRHSCFGGSGGNCRRGDPVGKGISGRVEPF